MARSGNGCRLVGNGDNSLQFSSGHIFQPVIFRQLSQGRAEEGIAGIARTLLKVAAIVTAVAVVILMFASSRQDIWDNMG